MQADLCFSCRLGLYSLCPGGCICNQRQKCAVKGNSRRFMIPWDFSKYETYCSLCFRQARSSCRLLVCVCHCLFALCPGNERWAAKCILQCWNILQFEYKNSWVLHQTFGGLRLVEGNGYHLLLPAAHSMAGLGESKGSSAFSLVWCLFVCVCSSSGLWFAFSLVFHFFHCFGQC